MTIKEPENNTDHVRMDKIKYGRDKQHKQNEGAIKPHLPTDWETAENKRSTQQLCLLLQD